MNTTEQTSKQILQKAISKSATDIHFSPVHTKTDIFFRIGGYRTFMFSIPKNEYHTLLAFYKFSTGMDIAETRKPQNGTLTHHQHQLIFDLRFSTLPVDESESLAVRILPRQLVPQLEELFLFPSQSNTLLNWIKRPNGMILFTGPTGSGKTTTMYALLQSLVKNSPYQAITLEDPIERDLDNILQVQVNEKAGITYDAGLRAALRHDPDILMVGEIRDKHTARFAFHAAFTGHLVLSTIHAKNAFGTIFRLLDMGISKTDLEQTLVGVASQQLISVEHKQHHKAMGRAAILELLDNSLLHHAIQGISPHKNTSFQSFTQLRRKAYALGFINECTL
ncbi:competence type IV pilus ATPase ComGA [Salinibacillus xinjiangensis]|uniref:Competence protein n=1 Tax=Salinibacillus xinjiangensis TaxID=1229268 RepID=A0A6G1X6I1_9BACI|nr:competence type IV pilus ATPase ComGA [Salinibacillus xinjiangensis]MRG86574.1 competence protein [Salinibacillus xinjiangensis]